MGFIEILNMVNIEWGFRFHRWVCNRKMQRISRMCLELAINEFGKTPDDNDMEWISIRNGWVECLYEIGQKYDAPAFSDEQTIEKVKQQRYINRISGHKTPR